jgi:hypothetical protein
MGSPINLSETEVDKLVVTLAEYSAYSLIGIAFAAADMAVIQLDQSGFIPEPGSKSGAWFKAAREFSEACRRIGDRPESWRNDEQDTQD